MKDSRLLLVAVLLVIALSVIACGGAAPATPQSGSAATIPIGALSDLTGATSDVGKDYALGVQEAVKYALGLPFTALPLWVRRTRPPWDRRTSCVRPPNG